VTTMPRRLPFSAYPTLIVACSLAVFAIVIAAPASADDDGQPHSGNNLSVTAAAPDSGVAARPSRHPPAAISDKQTWMPWQWVELEPGHDKCKRRKAWPLPLWCYGLSSWPVLKAQAVTANVIGIHSHSVSRTAVHRR
jgi:hypothetical protein